MTRALRLIAANPGEVASGFVAIWLLFIAVGVL